MNSLRISYDVTVSVNVDKALFTHDELLAKVPRLKITCDGGSVDDIYTAHAELVDEKGEKLIEYYL